MRQFGVPLRTNRYGAVLLRGHVLDCSDFLARKRAEHVGLDATFFRETKTGAFEFAVLTSPNETTPQSHHKSDRTQP